MTASLARLRRPSPRPAVAEVRTLEGLPTGTAQIEAVARAASTAHVRLRLFSGSTVEVALRVVPDGEGADAVHNRDLQALAVLIRHCAGRLDCSILATSTSGPVRVSVGLETALNLCEQGVHGVVRTESRQSRTGA